MIYNKELFCVTSFYQMNNKLKCVGVWQNNHASWRTAVIKFHFNSTRYLSQLDCDLETKTPISGLFVEVLKKLSCDDQLASVT